MVVCERRLAIWSGQLLTEVTIVQGALEWLEKNQDKTLEEIEEESKGSGSAVPTITDDAARSLKCDDCGKMFRNTAEAEFHASKTQHENFSQSTEEIAPLTEEEKKAKLEALKQKLAAKRAGQTEQDKLDQKRNEVRLMYLAV